MTEEAIERVASELALEDDYNPNDVPPKEWAAIRDRYRRVAAAAIELADFHWSNDPLDREVVAMAERAVESCAERIEMSEYLPNVKHVAGHILLSEHLFGQARRCDEASRELDWIALHYDKATDEQRAWLDRVIAAIDERDDWDD